MKHLHFLFMAALILAPPVCLWAKEPTTSSKLPKDPPAIAVPGGEMIPALPVQAAQARSAWDDILGPRWALLPPVSAPAEEPSSILDDILGPGWELSASESVEADEPRYAWVFWNFFLSDSATRNTNPSRTAVRFGWWFVNNTGSPTKTGMYQDLHSSPFFDVDGLWTNGRRTLDFSLSGLDNEANQVGVKAYGDNGSIDFFFQRFMRHLEHDPLNFPQGIFEQAPTYTPAGVQTAPGKMNRALVSQDLNVGEDYAIRVEELRGEAKGWLTDNLKYSVKVWGMRKFGERQVFGPTHCFNGPLAEPGVAAVHPFPVASSGSRSCHVLTRRQNIDWLTEEVIPSLEWRMGPVTVSYSHTIRSFSQNDQSLGRFYNSGNTADDGIRALGFNVAPNPINGTLGDYASVPENLTQYGQLRLKWELSPYQDFYANSLAGNTHNYQRQTDRDFYGFDLRLTDRSLPRLNTAAYAKMYGEYNEFPPFLRWDEIGPPPPGVAPWQITTPQAVAAAGAPFWKGTDGDGFLRHPWNYTRTSAGLKTRWQPLDRYDWISLIGGYDFLNLDRDYTTYEATAASTIPTDPDKTKKVHSEVGTTVYHTLHTRVNCQWSSNFDSYLGYSRRWIHNPQFAIHEPNGFTNSSLPTDQDIPEIGGWWYPAYNVIVSGLLQVIYSTHNDKIANFGEHDYNGNCTAWYAVSRDWSFTSGYSYFSNLINQDITLGDQVGGFAGNQDKPGAKGRINLAPITSRFNYGGQAHVVSFGSSYRLRPRVLLSGGLDWVTGLDQFDAPQPWPDLGTFSRVDVGTLRLRAGVDWPLFNLIPCYFRYIYFDYNDKSASFNSGTAHMLLAGGSYNW